MAKVTFPAAVVFGLAVMVAAAGPLRAGSPPPTPSASQCLAVVDVSQSNEVDNCTISGVNVSPGECELYGTCKTFWYARSDGWSESVLPPRNRYRTGCAAKDEDRGDATRIRYTCATTSNSYAPGTSAEFQNCDGSMRIGSC